VRTLSSANQLIFLAALVFGLGTGCADTSAGVPAAADPGTTVGGVASGGTGPVVSDPAPSGAEGPAATLFDLQVFWKQVEPSKLATGPRLMIAHGDTKTGCGKGTQDEGSFFCGDDATIYLQQVDLDALGHLSVPVRRASAVYLVAHEYGHYVQLRLGLPEGGQGTGPDSDTVHYELQADCLAGAYVANRDDALSPAAYTAAVRLVGDDVGPDAVPPEKFDHGSAAQRVAAFGRGLHGSAAACGLPTEP
jgi:predicted metalloprotease